MSAGLRAASRELRDVGAHPGERSFVKGSIYNTTTTGFHTVEQCAESPDDGPHARADINDRHPDPDWRAPLFTRHAHEPTVCLHERVVSRLPGKRSGVTERGNV